MAEICCSAIESDACAELGNGKEVFVEYLYLDLNTCERCIGTDLELVEVLDILTPALRLAGYDVQYKKIEMSTAELAREHRFLSSPTIRVNGRDIGGLVKENGCGCCSDISGSVMAAKAVRIRVGLTRLKEEAPAA